MPPIRFLGFDLSDMAQRVFVFTNPASLFVYFVVMEIVLKITFHVLNISWAKGFKWRLLVYAVLLLLSIIINFKTLFTNDYQRSLVNTSPIAKLSSEQISRLESVIKGLSESDFIESCEIEEKANHQYYYKSCYLVYQKKEPLSGVSVTISFYREEPDAIESMRVSAKGKHTSIAYNNNTEAVLYDSEMMRGELFFPSPDRLIVSQIRLRNVRIHLLETQKQDRLDMNASSDFIKLLCDMLIDAG